MIKAIWVLFFSLLLAGQTFARPVPLNLEAAVAKAYSANLDLQTLKKQVEVERAGEAKARSVFYPKLGLETRYESFSSAYIRQSGSTSGAFLEWNVFNGFQDRFVLQAQGLAKQGSELRLAKFEQSLSWEVGLSFYRLLAAQEKINLFEQALLRNAQQKEMARKRKAAGLVSAADVLELDLFESSLRSQRLTHASDFREAQAALRRILGDEEQSDFIPEGKLTHYHLDESLAEVLGRLNAGNVAISTGKLEVARAESMAKNVNGGFLPKLDLRATYGSRGLEDTLTAPETMLMGVAKWELFSGFDTLAARREAAARVAQAEASLSANSIRARSEAEGAFTRLRSLQEQVDFEVKSKDQALKYYSAVSDEYRRGIKNSSDLRGASGQVLEEELRDINHRLEFFEQKVRVEMAMGGPLKLSLGGVVHAE